MGGYVPQREGRAVRHCEQVKRVIAESSTDSIQVFHRGGRSILGDIRLRLECAAAARYRVCRIERFVGRIGRAELRAIEWARFPRTPLIEEDHVAMLMVGAAIGQIKTGAVGVCQTRATFDVE